MAREAGFDLVGIAPLQAPPDAERFASWLAEGRHGSMGYLERGAQATLRPDRAWPAGRSLLMVGMAHSRNAVELEDGSRVARYAAGRDYHNVIGKRLQKLRRRLAREALLSPGSAFVDATPLMERSHARAAGLGFASKAANLLHPDFGPWFFIGEVILDVDLEPTADSGRPFPSCGTCTACIDACPTGAITEPGAVDATRCISYANIEHRGLVPHGLREANGPWLFGCDVCSEVCPWGAKAPDRSASFGSHAALEAPRGGSLVHALLDPGRGGPPHAERWQGSPLRRPRADGLRRNAAVTAAALDLDGTVDALRRCLEDADAPTARAAAFWSLAWRYRADAGVPEALDRALRREVDADARADMVQSLERGPAGPTAKAPEPRRRP